MKVKPLQIIACTSALMVASLMAETTSKTVNIPGGTRTTVTESTELGTKVTVTETNHKGVLTHTKTTVYGKPSAVTKGTLEVSKLLRKHVKPTVSWNLAVSEGIEDLITFDSNGHLVPLRDLQASVTILGTGVTTPRHRGSYKSYDTKGRIKFGGKKWVTVHEGNEDEVIPGKIVYQTIAKQGKPIKFKAAFHTGYEWRPYRHQYSDEILTLIDGDRIPSNKPTQEAVTSAEEFLKPHLDEAGAISIGELDVIYVAELTHTDPTAPGYDLQDLIVHVSFSHIPKEK